MVPSLDSKFHLVLLGDSFTWGDGANFDSIAPQLLGDKWYNDARVIAFNYFRFPNEGTLAEQFGKIQQQYLTALHEYPHNVNVLSENSWSSLLDVHVVNLAMPGNSTAGMTQGLIDWLHKNKELCKTKPICVLANYNILNRLQIVSRFQQDGTFDPIPFPDNPYKICGSPYLIFGTPFTVVSKTTYMMIRTLHIILDTLKTFFVLIRLCSFFLH